MDRGVVGSELTRSMLKNGHQEVWCAVSDISDEDALDDQADNDFEEGQFYCNADRTWLYAVPIEISELTQDEAGF